MMHFKTKTLPSGTKKIPYQLKIVATLSLLSPLCLLNPAFAFNATPAIQLRSDQSVATQPKLIDAADWAEFSPSGGNFAISFPGTPSKKTTTEDDGAVAQTFTIGGDSGYYLVSYLDIPKTDVATPAQVQKFLDFVPEAFVKDLDAKLLGMQRISLDGYPGEEFSFTYKNTIAGKGRMYVVGQRAYMVMAVTTEEDNANKFFGSFRLLNNLPTLGER